MSDDNISRQAAIEYFITNVGWYDEDGHSIDDTDELRKIWTDLFNGVPPAPEKTARWELRTYLPHNNYCTHCGKDSPYNKRWEHCPHCGAHMIEEVDG